MIVICYREPVSVINLVPSRREAKNGAGISLSWDDCIHVTAFQLCYFSCREKDRARERERKRESKKVKSSEATANLAKQCFGTHFLIVSTPCKPS